MKQYQLGNLAIPYLEHAKLIEHVARWVRQEVVEIKNLRILRRSLDARKKDQLKYVYNVAFEVQASIEISPKSGATYYVEPSFILPEPILHTSKRPVIIGAGPAGLFAALTMAKLGYRPLVLEQGETIGNRVQTVAQLWLDGTLNPRSNVQFGEGGAGAFSDGKLTCRKQDQWSRVILQALIESGAPEEILWEAKPHLGTDRLRGIVLNLRSKIEQFGGEFYFNEQLTDIDIEQGKLKSIQTDKRSIETDTLIIAMGHSARDTLLRLKERGLLLEAKGFAMGFRIVHPRGLIDEAQYGKRCNFDITGAAEYALTYQADNGRGVYSFCMCPGGEVICSASEPGGVVVNGMSYSGRAGKYSNSAIVATVRTEDFNNDPLQGMNWQRQIEVTTANTAVSGKVPPAFGQNVLDFINHKIGKLLYPDAYKPQLQSADLRQMYPDYITAAIQEALPEFENKIPGFVQEGMLIGPETRTSAPYRITRNAETMESLAIKGIYPIGESSGYAGGIVSSAADGLKLGSLFEKV